MSFNWKSILSSVAPTLATAVSGSAGGIAAKFIASKFLGQEEATIEEIEKAIVSSKPEDLLVLRKLDDEFKVEMRKLDIDVFALEAKDRDSARKLYSVDKTPQIILSAIFVVGYFIVLYLIMQEPNGDKTIINNPVFTTILGVLTAAIPQILGFWFGSSSGSKDKNKLIKGDK